jgi:GPH family glycoside/pentoside/hexuronide:cation symporter
MGRRIGKRRSLIAGSLLFGGCGVVMVAAPVLPAVAIYLIAAVVGVGYAGQQVFAMAMAGLHRAGHRAHRSPAGGRLTGL